MGMDREQRRAWISLSRYCGLSWFTVLVVMAFWEFGDMIISGENCIYCPSGYFGRSVICISRYYKVNTTPKPWHF